ncbi:MAG TPA: glycosyltransferase family 39 protein [Thermoanaerobaculia bacterium]|nr:glycosyltransferase family 39 protein [Thermoanaerobaculia bacterium]
MNDPAPRARHRLSTALWIVPPLLAGSALRLLGCARQILGSDELHAVRAALSQPLSSILVTYQANDNCIPLTAFYRALLDLGTTFSETTFRLPILAAGIALLALAPLAAERYAGRAPAALFAWLLAISPILALYSRIVRSYMPIVLLTFAAAIAFFAWLESRRWRYGIAYVALASLAVYFHLVSGPFVLAPFVFAVCDGLPRSRRHDGRWRPLAVLLGSLLLGLAAFTLPALGSLRQIVAAKRGGSVPGAGALISVLELQAGTAQPALLCLFWGAALAGLVLLCRRHARFAAFTATLVLGQVAGLLVLAPYQLSFPVVLDRYLIVVLPWVLLWVASAWSLPGPAPGRAEAPRAPGWQWARWALAGIFVAALLAAGPFADPALRTTSFAHHDDFVLFSCPRPSLAEADIPPFYRQLAGARDAALLEYPWSAWMSWQSLLVYQQVHRQEIVVATPAEVIFDDPRLALRNMVPADPERFLASRARFVVVHLDPPAEESRVRQPPCGGRPPRSIRRPRLRQALQQWGRDMAAELARRWGNPSYRDGSIAVWDLDRARAAGAAKPAEGLYWNAPAAPALGQSAPAAPGGKAARAAGSS